MPNSTSSKSSASKPAPDILEGLVETPLIQIREERFRRQEQAERDKVTRNFSKMRNRQTGRGGLLNFVSDFWDILEPATELVDGWPLEAICLHLEAVTFGDINRLLINVPPGFMKSLLVNVFWPAWEWGPMNMPHLRYLAFSYALHLTMRDNDKLVRLVSSPRYRELWGDRFELTKTGAHKPENDRTGYKFATSIEGVGTGERGDRVLLDDPHNVIKIDSQGVMEKTIAFFRTSMSNRLNDMVRSAIVVVMQRLSETDVSGNILEREANYCHLCYDDKTEILTREGWVAFHSLANGIEVLGVDPRTLLARWEAPTRYVKERHIGEMIHYKSLTADLMVTPDHRMVYGDSNDMLGGKCGQWRVREASELPQDFYLPQVVNWSGSDEDVLFGGRNWAPLSFAEFMGWYLSEGCASGKRCVARIVQNIDGRYVGEIDRILGGIPFGKIKRRVARPGVYCWSIGDKKLAYALEALGKSLSKRAPDVLKNLSPKNLQAFLLAYAKGDGHHARNPRKIFIGTGSKVMADDLQECAIKAGWSATVSVCEVSAGRKFNGYVMPASTIYRVYLRASKAAGAERKIASKIGSRNINSVPFDGYVYCVSVPSTAIVVRRNGRVSISGNCIPMEFESARYPVDSDGTTVLYEGNDIGWIDPRALDDNGDLVSAQELASRDGELAWAKRFSRNVIENDIKSEQGPTSYSGQYQQSPVNLKGGIFQRDWWQQYEVPTDGPRAGKFPDLEYVVVSIDPAFTEKEQNDPTGCTTWGLFYDEEEMPRLIMLSAWRKHLQIHGSEQAPQGVNESMAKYQARCMPHWGLVEWIVYTAGRFGGADAVLVEAKASGLDVINELKRLYSDEKWGVIAIKPNKDKVARALSVQPTLAGGIIYAPYGETGWKDWADLVINEMALFPKGRFDDLTDSSTQAWKWLREQGLIRRPDEIVRQLEFEKSYEFVKTNRKKVLYHA